ncbi:MAG: glycosyltransferase family 4 protein [Candidimonas sp.]|nr:glycosyltransferase family 4 protein [Candidimonas sp.]
MKPTFWYLNHYIPSARAPKKGRAFYLLNAVALRGYKVAVVGAARHHLAESADEQVERFRFQAVGELLFGWARTPAYQGNGLWRVINMLVYSWQLLFLSKSLPTEYSRPDVIIVSSVHPFHYPVALWLSWRYRARLVFEVRDIWPLTLHELMGVPKWHPLYVALACIERLAYRSADEVISLLVNGLQHMGRRGLNAERFTYIPNGIDFTSESIEPVVSSHDSCLVQIRRDFQFVVMYTGAHGIPNALDQLLEAAEILQRRGDKVAFVLVGSGGEKARLQRLAEELRLDNLFFLAPVPAAQVQHLLHYADACFIGWQKKPLYKYGVSANKIFEFMKAAKPIVQCIDSVDNPVALSGCGFDSAPQRPELLVETILRLVAMSPQERETLGQKGYRFVLEEHDYQLLAERFIRVCAG